MTQQAAITIMIVAALSLIALGVWAWARRSRRDRGIQAPVGEAPAGATTTAVFPVLYVATTRGGEPLERLAIRGLAYRSRADLTVTDAGLALDLTGQPRVFLASARIADVDQSTVTIDRVVERDGLVRLSWRLDDGTVVDTYLRPQEASARAVADAVSGLLTPTQTGTDA
ncbi:PH-like domain-containing protein [Microbacterium sp. HJ5]